MTFDPDFASAGEWARLYRSRGLQVLPACSYTEVRPGTAWKRPLFKSWVEYQEALVPDDKFNEWYGPGGTYVSRPNMGLICGRASGGRFVIDLDIHKHDAAGRWWMGLMNLHNNNMDLETVEQRTGGGGLQKIFQAPPGWTPPTCKTLIGVDIRGQGGWAMMAPSMHESGKPYAWLDGRAPDETEILMAPPWLVEAVDALVREHGGNPSRGPHVRSTDSQSAFDGFGHQTDGREDAMFRMVWRCVLDWRRESGPVPPPEPESARKARDEYEVYERGVSPQQQHPAGLSKTEQLDREGRGWREWWSKWRHATKQWGDKVREEASKPDPNPDPGPQPHDYADEFAKAQAPGAPPPATYELLSVRDLKALADPQWLVDGMVVEQAMGFIFGPPGCLKTFIALGMALSLTTGRPTWWGRAVQRKGAVIYICSEGTKSLKFRITAWEKHFKTSADDSPFMVIRQNINFMREEDVIKLLHTVQSAVDRVGPVAAVFVDTVSRVLPGAEENLQKDMTVFVAACDAVRQTFEATVIGLHHTNANGGFRGSTVMPGAGDFLLEVRREPGARVGSIYAQKIKDDTDGWEQAFKVTEIDLSGIVPRTSLVVDSDAVPEQREGENKDKATFDVREQILRELDKAWCAGKPWAHAPNTARSGVNVVMKRWGLTRKAAKGILDTWLAKDIIEEATFSTRDKTRGYRKMKDL